MTICLIFKHEVAINRRNNLILLRALELVLIHYFGIQVRELTTNRKSFQSYLLLY